MFCCIPVPKLHFLLQFHTYITGIPLGVLNNTARKKISEKLQAQNPPENQPVWEILLDEEELDIKATETSEIGI